MRTCAQIQEDFLEGLYGELDQHRQRSLQAHLKSCAGCRREFESLRATLEVMSRRQRPQPAEDSPETASSLRRLQDQILHSARETKTQPFTSSDSRSNRRWLMQMAAGIALIALGVVIGRMTIDRGPSVDGGPADLASATDATADGADSPSPTEALALRVGGYVSSSQALLVGLANLDPEAEGIESFDLAPQKQLSRRLLEEASYLRGSLDDRESREVVELIADLESILRQIANLEAQHDVEGIEIIRQGVESSGILIKIQLQKIRPHPVVPQKDTKSKEAA
ncbi:MAG TPA: zf-HC2 domain-containing protein [Acidobacteriota bacterium]|nr:zf-HC2 domain-containing protein [Acidobacteriota bacterium]